MYTPPPPLAAKEEAALKELHDMINEHENVYPDRAFILGYFNHCKLKKKMPKLHQYVIFPTKGNKTLDHCYSNIRNIFSAKPKP